MGPFGRNVPVCGKGVNVPVFPFKARPAYTEERRT